MSTPVIALTTDEAEAIARGNAALAWVRADTFPWPRHGRTFITAYAGGLRDTLDDYADLTAGRTHPATLFPDLGHGQDNAMELALDRVTEDIGKWTAAFADLASVAEAEARAREEEEAA